MTRAYLDEPIHKVAGGGEMLRISVAALELLEEASGLTVTECLSGDDEKLTYRTTAFLELYRRAPHDHLPPGGEAELARDLWARARTVEIILEEAPPAPNPLNGASSTTSPLSVGTGE